MKYKRLVKQLKELDFPHLIRCASTREVHPRVVALSHDGKESAVSIHPSDGTRAQIYYHGSRSACRSAYMELLKLFENQSPIPA